MSPRSLSEAGNEIPDPARTVPHDGIFVVLIQNHALGRMRATKWLALRFAPRPLTAAARKNNAKKQKTEQRQKHTSIITHNIYQTDKDCISFGNAPRSVVNKKQKIAANLAATIIAATGYMLPSNSSTRNEYTGYYEND